MTNNKAVELVTNPTEVPKYLKHSATGKIGKFSAKFAQYAERNGQAFIVLGVLNPQTYDVLECGELFCIRFGDGVEIEAWPEEIQSANADHVFDYQLLARLQQDCEYYLGAGKRNKKHLWALDEAAQIEKMKELYHKVPFKPEWLTLEAINAYAGNMIIGDNRPADALSERADSPSPGV